MASTTTRDLQQEFLAATRKSQETMVRAIKTWVETVRSVTPKLPSGRGPLAGRLPKLPSVTVPFAGRLPKPEDVVASSYDFAGRLLALQRKFAEDLLDVTAPLMPRNGSRVHAVAAAPKAAPAPKTVPVAAETTPKAVAVKAEPKPPAVKAEAVTPAVKAEPKPAAAKPAPKAAPATRAPRSTAAKSAPKPAAPKPAPKSTGAS